VAHTSCLLCFKGTEFSTAVGGQELSVVTLLLEGSSSSVCSAWVAAGRSLLTPLEGLLAVGPRGDGDSDAMRVQELLKAVLPPLSKETGGQPNVVSRMLGRRGRRFLLNAHHWLRSAAPGVLAGASVIRKVGDAVDDVALAPLVGPALQIGLLVVQVPVLAVLADGHDARRENAVKRCEGVACDLLGRVFTERQRDPADVCGAGQYRQCRRFHI